VGNGNGQHELVLIQVPDLNFWKKLTVKLWSRNRGFGLRAKLLVSNIDERAFPVDTFEPMTK
jgi:hypothetical protein